MIRSGAYRGCTYETQLQLSAREACELEEEAVWLVDLVGAGGVFMHVFFEAMASCPWTHPSPMAAYVPVRVHQA